MIHALSQRYELCTLQYWVDRTTCSIVQDDLREFSAVRLSVSLAEHDSLTTDRALAQHVREKKLFRRKNAGTFPPRSNADFYMVPLTRRAVWKKQAIVCIVSRCNAELRRELLYKAVHWRHQEKASASKEANKCGRRLDSQVAAGVPVIRIHLEMPMLSCKAHFVFIPILSSRCCHHTQHHRDSV